MVTISASDAVLLVRKNLDEIGMNDSVMYSTEDPDNTSLDDTIEKSLPEAINRVHLAAPAQLLEGETPGLTRQQVSLDSEGVLTVSLGSDSEYLRLCAFQADDSEIVVTSALGEATPEGRKQLNRFIRGRADRPRLVLMQGSGAAPVFKYYTVGNPSEYKTTVEDVEYLLPLDPDPEPQGYSWWPEVIKQFSYVKELKYDSTSPATEYNVSSRLWQNAIDCLTAIVLEVFSDQRAQIFYQKANIFQSI